LANGARASQEHSVRQYLARHATAEVRLAEAISARYRAVLVVPAFREAPGLLTQYRTALARAPGRVLTLVVVNAAQSHAQASWPLHRELLEDLRGDSARALGSEHAWLAHHPDTDVLCIDRAHPERCFPDGQGVGLARRIGCDLALALYAAGRVEDPFVYCTDADAGLPADYFGGPALGADVAALVFPFWHVPGGDPPIDAATALYELGLRYYVDGLAQAGSPFAFHTVGSALAVRASAYAAVRGFPKRLAGEDFYVLNKLAKVGTIARVAQAPLRLRSRASLRTVHGTGAAAVRLAAQADISETPFYHPGIFPLLGHWLRALERFAQTRQLALVRAELEAATGESWTALQELLDELGAWPALEQAAAQCHGASALLGRLHTWFDAFRTLKLVHGLRRRGWSSLPFREALAGSACCSVVQARHATIDELRSLLLEREAGRAALLGVGSTHAGT
jgi:hypothetical protein